MGRSESQNCARLFLACYPFCRGARANPLVKLEGLPALQVSFETHHDNASPKAYLQTNSQTKLRALTWLLVISGPAFKGTVPSILDLTCRLQGKLAVHHVRR